MPLEKDPLSEASLSTPPTLWGEESFEVLLSEASESISDTSSAPQDIQHRVYDSIKDIDTILGILSEKKYDFALVQPSELTVSLTFRLDSREAEKLEISYPIYNKVLLEAKKRSGLILDENSVEQEWKSKIVLWGYEFFLAVKTAPSKYGEKIWLKIKKNENAKKVVKKVSTWAILSFIGGISFVWLILSASLISFVVFNTQTIDDVVFFTNLGINYADINNFIRTIITVIFSILTFLLTIALSFFLFKFYFTKKIYKRKKITYGITSVLFLILTSTTALMWMYLDTQAQNLPNWQQQQFWDIIISDNEMRINPDFPEDEYRLTEMRNLIWPISLHFDVSNYVDRMAREWVTIERFIWNLAGQTTETLIAEHIQELSRSGNFPLSIEAIGTHRSGREHRENLTRLPTLSLSAVIDINEIPIASGWKRYDLNAQSLSSLGQVSWYLKSPSFVENIRFPDWEKVSDEFRFIPGQIFFEPIYVWVWIQTWQSNPILRKILILNPQSSSNIEAEIRAVQSFENELHYSFQVINASTGFSDGFIENFVWRIENRTYNSNLNPDDVTKSQEIKHSFIRYWEQRIQVTLTDSRWNERVLVKNINIERQVRLSQTLEITDSTTRRTVENMRYNPRAYEYFIDDLWVPTTLRFDARNVRPENLLYRLEKVTWDVWDNWDLDNTDSLQFEHKIETPWNHTLAINYTFQHRTNPNDTINIVEKVYVWAVRKEAIIRLDINTDTQYAPAIVSFDASLSFIRDDDIVKFIYDYGNGIIEERDAVNPGHRYREPWEYTITLTAVGSKWGRYSTTETLILLPTPQRLQIDTSMKRAPVGQGIDFSSAGSQGQIAEYFWNFWDGGVSTLPNPSHTYRRPGKYTVTLEVSFANFNTRTATIEVEIYE